LLVVRDHHLREHRIGGRSIARGIRRSRVIRACGEAQEGDQDGDNGE
jgi:hypothetical protein